MMCEDSSATECDLLTGSSQECERVIPEEISMRIIKRKVVIIHDLFSPIPSTGRIRRFGSRTGPRLNMGKNQSSEMGIGAIF
jgi:hypothetical protein